MEKYVRERNTDLELTLSRYQQEISERIKTEEVLKIFKLIVRESNNPQAYVDNKGIIVIANTAYEKLVNMTAMEIVGKDYETLISRIRGRACYDLEIKPCLDTVFLRGERTYRAGWVPGEYGRRFLSRTYAPCRDGEKIAGVIITIHDITHLMIALDQLAETEARFRNLLENFPNVAVQGYRQDGTIFYWNLASEHIYGYSAEEAVGRNILDLVIPPGIREEVKVAMRQMAHSGVTIPASEWWLVRKDGTPVLVYSSHAIVKKEGVLPELFCTDIDLTERMLAEKALLEQKAHLRSILDTIRDGFCIVDLRGNLVDVNEAYCRMTGYSRGELLRLNIKDLEGDETPSEIAERVERIITNGCELFELRYRKSDGTLRNFEISSTLLNENGGQVVNFCGTSRNGSGPKQRWPKPRKPRKRPVGPKATSWPR
ncbi:PAS domain-containing protein [Desulfonatronum lacustre]|uniref:PAS domain-containing protein n=1 Tax=Desulfonatronum lacustre TaxID=66849 RepID=UPI00049151AE|nr:PAS domain-containing protein [Desulfonatronum lacustre]